VGEREIRRDGGRHGRTAKVREGRPLLSGGATPKCDGYSASGVDAMGDRQGRGSPPGTGPR
jgi:hypothetical protein